MSRARKIAVVGSRSVGKSSMTVQYVEEHFVESYYPTIENQFSKTISFKNQEYAIEILDTAGQDEFSIMNQKHLIGIHGYILVYSIASKNSFDMLQVIRDKIIDSTGNEHLPMIVVGNKNDLEAQRQVTRSEGENWAKSFGYKFIECSARTNSNVDQVFELLIAEIEKAANPGSEKEEKCVIT
ncbi:hypothetical protein PACTADRAFT_15811 [Pachysolen tannophilus NRRL Y-2460]|uniref:GTP-binding protein rhb1 n=1 Tax=Pachysolen tannophilus NRRL Y-2460 TaxID=669874 RepID=A0A1E4U010_PACTA|nr:hypothetical protein PACTADRAFT_15811 [Pachysolen tannophilus NRRL Y-2460]